MSRLMSTYAIATMLLWMMKTTVLEKTIFTNSTQASEYQFERCGRRRSSMNTNMKVNDTYLPRPANNLAPAVVLATLTTNPDQ